MKQIVENYLIANDGIEYVDEDNQPTYDSIDLDALEKHAVNALKGKRNVAAMARLGLMRETVKRSLANLAKNGQLPSRENADDESGLWSSDKRNIGSIARGGSLNGKRNVGALARDFLLPQNGKRNLPSILRSGGGGSSTSSTHGPHQPKRNVATLARDNFLPFYHQSKNEKRDVTAANNERMFNCYALSDAPNWFHFNALVHFCPDNIFVWNKYWYRMVCGPHIFNTAYRLNTGNT